MRRKKEFLIKCASLILAILASIFVASIFLYVCGLNPATAWQVIAYGAVGSRHNMSESMVVAIPLMLAGLGVGFAFKCGVWNIGAEGQLYMGAVGASAAALYLPCPAPWHLIVVMLAAVLVGGGWAVIPGMLKMKLKVNEILTTLMMNYIAIWIVHYLVYGPWRSLKEINPQTAFFPTSTWLPILVPRSRLHAGLLIGLICAVFMYVVFRYTKLGYNIKVVGTNPKAAQYGGISVSKTVIVAMFISGGLAGLAGMGELCGIHHYLRDGIYRISPGYGYISIGAALLGGLNAWGIVIASIFIGCLFNGVSYLKTMVGSEYLHANAPQLIVGVLILAVLAKGIFVKRLMPKGKEN